MPRQDAGSVVSGAHVQLEVFPSSSMSIRASAGMTNHKVSRLSDTRRKQQFVVESLMVQDVGDDTDSEVSSDDDAGEEGSVLLHPLMELDILCLDILF